VLAALGVSLDLTPEQVGRAIDKIGIGFLFAPKFHPAMKHAVGPRKEIGQRTIFNVLGPLTNPAGADVQLIGRFGPAQAAHVHQDARDAVLPEDDVQRSFGGRVEEVEMPHFDGVTEVGGERFEVGGQQREVMPGEVGRELQESRAAAVAEALEAAEKFGGLQVGAAQTAAVGDDLRKFQAELEAGRRLAAPALDSFEAGRGIECRVALHGVEAAAVEREKIALPGAGRKEHANPGFQPPHGQPR